MRLRLKDHYIAIHTNTLHYLIQCSCGFSSKEQLSYDDMLKFCLKHTSYSVSDYLKDKKWCESQEAFYEQTKDVIQDTSLTISEVEIEVEKVQNKRERYETCELLFPIIERELAENVLY